MPDLKNGTASARRSASSGSDWAVSPPAAPRSARCRCCEAGAAPCCLRARSCAGVLVRRDERGESTEPDQPDKRCTEIESRCPPQPRARPPHRASRRRAVSRRRRRPLRQHMHCDVCIRTDDQIVSAARMADRRRYRPDGAPPRSSRPARSRMSDRPTDGGASRISASPRRRSRPAPRRRIGTASAA